MIVGAHETHAPAVAEAPPRCVPTRRIAFVLPCLLPFGGVERLLVSQAEQLIGLGFGVDFVFVSESKDLSGALPSQARVFNLDVSRIRDALIPLVRYLRAEAPDAVHAAMWPMSSAVVLAAKLARSRARVIVSDHNPLSIQYSHLGPLRRWMQRASLALTYRLADARVVVSSAVADDLAGLSGIDRDRFTVIHNPISIDIDDTDDQSSAEAAWNGWAGKRILTVGRLKTQKNHRLLIRAFRRLLEQQDARLMILGVGELSEATAEAVREAGLDGKVVMPGQVENPAPYYRSADLFVLSSDYEGFGNVLVEALACGLPVVSTNCPGGPAEILQDGLHGRLVTVGDEVGLAVAMGDALAASHDTEALKRRADDFSPAIALDRYLRLMFPRESSSSTGTARYTGDAS